MPMLPRPARGNNQAIDALAALATPASEALIVDNDALAISIAKRYFRLCKGFDEWDAVQIARIGLVRAARRYDPNKISPHTLAPIKFSSFAVPFIRGEILHYVRDRGHMLKVPRRLRERASKVEKTAQTTGQSPKDVCESLGFDWAELEEIIELHLVYPDQEFFEESLAIDEADKPSHDVMRLLGCLPRWQSALIVKHYYQRQTIEQIAKAMDRDPACVQAWIDDAHDKMRDVAATNAYASAA